jgi:hypothetical protein
MRRYLIDTLYNIVTNTAVIAVFIFSLLIIASFGEYMVNDEGIWNYIAFLWIKYGIPPYTEAIENKTPGIYLIFTISNLLFELNIWFPRLLGSLSMVATSILIYFIGRKLLDHFAGIIAMIIFGLSVSWKFMNGTYTAQTESFMILFSTLSFFFLIVSRDAKRIRSYVLYILIAGFCMGIAICFKQTAIFSAGALLAFLLSLGYGRDCQLSSSVTKDLLFLLAGAIFPLCLCLIVLLASGTTFAQFLHQAWLVLLQEGGGAELKTTKRIWSFISTWRYSEMILFYPLFLLFIIQKKRIEDNKIPFWGIIFWIIFDFIGVNASGFYFGHQFKQLVPPLSLASGIAISVFLKNTSTSTIDMRRYIVQIVVVLAILWAPYQTLLRSYNMNFKDRINDEYKEYKELGLWLRENTKETDFVYLIGGHTNPALAYSQRRSASRYFSLLFIEREGAKNEVMEDLTEKKPKYIIIDQKLGDGSVRVLPGLEAILEQSYRHKMTNYNVEIYERKG